jgi:hypothetical protein
MNLLAEFSQCPKEMKLKLLIFASIALILNLITMSPAKAEVTIAGLAPKSPIAKISCTQRLCQSFRIVEEMAPMFVQLGGNITGRIFYRQDLGDRLFNFNDKSGVACLVDGEGSRDGSITCGVLDKF